MSRKTIQNKAFTFQDNMDDVEAAIQALEWGKNEFLGHGVSPSSLASPSPTTSTLSTNMMKKVNM